MTSLELARKITHAYELAAQCELYRLEHQIKGGADLDELAVKTTERINEMLYQVVKVEG